MILIGTDEGIYRWTGGNNWPVFHALQGRSIVGLSAPGTGTLAALEKNGRVWESIDHGQTWREVPRPEGIGRASALVVGGVPASIVLAGPGPSLHRRAIGRTTRIGSPIRLARQAGPAILDRARTLVARSRGGSATAMAPRPRKPDGWSPLGPTGPIDDQGRPDVRALLTTPTAWYAAVDGRGLWRSGDAGATWSHLGPLPSQVNAIRGVAGKPGHLVAATAAGVWFSDDDGQTWEDRGAGLGASRRVRAIDVCPAEPGFLLVGATPTASDGPRAAPREGLGYGLHESRDGGRTWTRVLRSFPENAHFDAITDIRFDPAEPDRAAVAFESGELWCTLNGGDYWQPIARDIRAARVLCPVG